MNRVALVCMVLLCISCERNEIAIEKHPMGEIQVKQINMGIDYSQQIYYSASENSIVSSNTKDNWDLAFHSSQNSSQIIINSSTFSQICELEDYDFEDPISIVDLTWKWDNPEGIYSGTAVNSILSTTTYILDRGYNLDGTQKGYKKFKVDYFDNNSFIITYANLDNTEINSIEIKKDSLFNYQHISFNDNVIVSVEPEKKSWDLVFTQYTHLYINNLETPAYLVTGVLTNYLNNVLIAKDTVNSFEEINLGFINTYNFSQYQNEIGYNWKVFDFANQLYTIKPDLIYIIKDVSDRYFKMRFIDFYNDLGEKGSPKFEIQEL
tara:strand:+ start:42863 stop:43828 length:966 start_codon:yes stop_codon:yes gene_type:complete